jgi:hypothetical protein
LEHDAGTKGGIKKPAMLHCEHFFAHKHRETVYRELVRLLAPSSPVKHDTTGFFELRVVRVSCATAWSGTWV